MIILQRRQYPLKETWQEKKSNFKMFFLSFSLSHFSLLDFLLFSFYRSWNRVGYNPHLPIPTHPLKSILKFFSELASPRKQALKCLTVFLKVVSDIHFECSFWTFVEMSNFFLPKCFFFQQKKNWKCLNFFHSSAFFPAKYFENCMQLFLYFLSVCL